MNGINIAFKSVNFFLTAKIMKFDDLGDEFPNVIVCPVLQAFQNTTHVFHSLVLSTSRYLLQIIVVFQDAC